MRGLGGRVPRASRADAVTRLLEKRSVALAGHRTSVALEPEFWQALEEVARTGGETLSALLTRLDGARDPARPLASALRVAALAAVRGIPQQNG